MKRLQDVYWINLAWQAAVDTVTAFWISQKWASKLTEWLIDFQESPYSVQLFVALKSSEVHVDVVADGGMIMHGYGAFMKS